MESSHADDIISFDIWGWKGKTKSQGEYVNNDNSIVQKGGRIFRKTKSSTSLCKERFRGQNIAEKTDCLYVGLYQFWCPENKDRTSGVILYWGILPYRLSCFHLLRRLFIQSNIFQKQNSNFLLIPPQFQQLHQTLCFDELLLPTIWTDSFFTSLFFLLL